MKSFSILFLIGIVQLSFAQNETQSLQLQQYIADVIAKKTDTSYHYNAIPVVANAVTSTGQHLPYPIIFMHGLQGSSDSWMNIHNDLVLKGFSYGGTLPFCLNADGNVSTANLTTDIANFTGTLQPADFYLVNFNVDTDGTSHSSSYDTPSQSHMSAITKGGVAMKMAINAILQVTGRNKVVLFGHSMGGLTSREYIQNAVNWQLDNQHHVAKLVTDATPHGGSNTTGGWVGSSVAPDEKSEAVRDLRRTYFYSGDPGVYLFGGVESNSVMNDMLFSNFYNTDVNCNGVTGQTIVGLNQKLMPTDLDFTCIIGNWSLSPTNDDGIVRVQDAQIKNFYPSLVSESYTVTCCNHVALHDLVKEMYWGFDEPDFSHLAYGISTNTLYSGFITEQAVDAQNTITDIDYYTFSVPQNTFVTVNVKDIKTKPFNLSIVNSSNAVVYSQAINSSTFQTSTLALPSGNYYLKAEATPNDTSWKKPYQFIINNVFNPTTNLSVFNNLEASVQVYPNPVNDKLNYHITQPSNDAVTVKVMSMLGEELINEALPHHTENAAIDLTHLAAGEYVIVFSSKLFIQHIKVLKL